MAGRAAVLALAGLATMAAGAEGAPWAKGGAKRKVSFFVEGTGCAHDVEAKPVRLEKAKQGVLGWRIQNDCNIGRKALVCVYDADGKLSNPFDACTSLPPGVDVARVFTLTAGGGKAEMECAVKSEGAYSALVLVGDEVKPAGCPAAPPKERVGAIGDRTFVHRLAVEIVP